MKITLTSGYNDYSAGKYLIKYDNDTGPDDESFDEWLDIIDTETGETICSCGDINKAEQIVNKLLQ